MELELGRHVDEATLERYVMGTLSGDAAAEVEQHLLICESCRQRTTETEDYVQAVRSVAATLPAEPERSRWGIRIWIPVLVCAALLVFVISRRGSQGRLSPALVTLTTTRGVNSFAAGPAGRPLEVQLDLRGLPVLPRYELEFVNAAGKSKWKGEFQPPSTMLPAQTTGVYFVRVSLPDGTLLREYRLELSP